MNNLILNRKKQQAPQLQYGDLFLSSNDEVFLLARFNTDKVAAVSLKDGNRWLEPTKNAYLATKGLIHLGADFEISITESEK